MALEPQEMIWVEKQPWLLSCGYELRPRFQPGWVPSWVTNPPADVFEMRKREDRICRGPSLVMDAIRLKDKKPVMLKQVYKHNNGFDQELAISQYVSSPDLLKDPDNHCIPIYEVLDIPGDSEYVIIVMPLLHPFNATRFDTIGECLDFFHQIFKGLQFLHKHHIAHRDCTQNNVMMDPSEIYPDGFHPVKYNMSRDLAGPAFQKYTRTQRPPKYYWIDFGLSVQFKESDKFPQAMSIRGGDKSPPEFRDMAQLHTRRNPFPTDIYYLGNLIRIHFTEGRGNDIEGFKFGLSFMKPLVAAMVHEDMSKRPTIDQCVVHLEDIIQAQSTCTLRAQVWHSTDSIFGFLYRFFPHWARRITYILTQTPAIPHLTPERRRHNHSIP